MSVRAAARKLLEAWDANNASAHHKALIALRAALADDEDARDSARYRWLREKMFLHDSAYLWSLRFDKPAAPMTSTEYRSGIGFDAAIDAAMQEPRK